MFSLSHPLVFMQVLLLQRGETNSQQSKDWNTFGQYIPNTFNQLQKTK